MKRRILALVLALCLCVTALVEIPNNAYASSSEFDIRDGVLYEYLGEGGDVVIPNGVTSIYYRAFSKSEHAEKITNVTLPSGITVIGYMAFSGCSMRSIELPAAVLDNPVLVEKYDQQCKAFTKQMQDKLDEYEAENRFPDDELKAFYEKMKQDIMRFVYALEAGAE